MRKSQQRWEVFNELIDDWAPKLTNAQAVLLVYYFRHARVRGTGAGMRNVFKVGDGQAGKQLGKTKQSIARLRSQLIVAGVVHKHKTQGGVTVYYLGKPLLEGTAPVPKTTAQR